METKNLVTKLVILFVLTATLAVLQVQSLASKSGEAQADYEYTANTVR